MNAGWVIVVLSVVLAGTGAGLYWQVQSNGELRTTISQRDESINTLNGELESQKADLARIDRLLTKLDQTKAANEANANEMRKTLNALRQDAQISACMDVRLPDGFAQRMQSGAHADAGGSPVPAGVSAAGLPSTGR